MILWYCTHSYTELLQNDVALNFTRLYYYKLSFIFSVFISSSTLIIGEFLGDTTIFTLPVCLLILWVSGKIQKGRFIGSFKLHAPSPETKVSRYSGVFFSLLFSFFFVQTDTCVLRKCLFFLSCDLTRKPQDRLTGLLSWKQQDELAC